LFRKFINSQAVFNTACVVKKQTMKKIFLLLLVVLTIQNWGQAQTPAFPGAEGGGMYVTGGRGGTVYYVNTLEDNSTGNTTTREGSLRWCLERTGPRIILFKVSGIIQLKRTLSISRGDVTIAGQSAPGDGICIKDYEVKVDAENVIIRYMRFRLGDEITTHEPDAFWGRYKKNIIIDHCSVSWSIDECSSFYSNENFTMQWCFITESLNTSIHEKGNHGYGAIWGGQNATFHHNLLAHHNSRNPRFNGWKRSGIPTNPNAEERVDYRNNVIYNWGDNSAYGGESSGKYNIVNNYYKYGPATKSSAKSRIVTVSMDSDPVTYSPGYGQFYIDGNYVYGNSTVTSNNWNSSGVLYDSGVDKIACKASVPFEAYPITEHTALVAFDKVLELGGASLSRDAVDSRVSEEVKNGTITFTGSVSKKGGIIDSQTDLKPADAGDDWTAWPTLVQGEVPTDSDRDGIPDGWLEANHPGKMANDVNDIGYTYLEVYLNSLVKHITDKQGEFDDGGDVEEEILFGGPIPTDKVVPETLSNLITDGAISIASGRTDGCTEDGYVWRTKDVTFTLPSMSKFSVNLTSNGGRKVHITINGDEANKDVYTIGSSSCESVVYTFDGSVVSPTIRIESFNSAGDTPMDFSLTQLLIKEIKSTTSIDNPSIVENNIKVYIANDILYANVVADMSVYSVNGGLTKAVKNTDSIYVGDINGGVYIVRMIGPDGMISVHKFVK